MAKKRPSKKSAKPDARLAAMAGDVPTTPEHPTRKRDEPKPTRDQEMDRETRRWQDRIVRANKTYEEWEKKFECKHLDAYYEGEQWRGLADNEAKKKYVINMIFATEESQLPALMFTKPKVKCEARPSHQMTPGSQAGARATLIEQSVQTVVDNPSVGFMFEADLALRDTYSRFGVLEVGYSADWVDNPHAGKPILNEDDEEMRDPHTKEPLVEPKQVLKPDTKETVYLARIDPATFRVSPGTKNSLSANDWCGYFDWVPLGDIKKNKQYTNLEGLKGGGSLDSTTDEEIETEEKRQARTGMVKLWKIWDLRAKQRIVLAEGHPKLLQKRAYMTLPFGIMKFFERRNSFYPVPPIYNWLSPQDEINETREMQRIHRRRAVRRYMVEPSVDAVELEKLETNLDMTAIKVPSLTPTPPIMPIADAPLHPQNTVEELAITNDDLNKIAGVTGESRNSPTAKTATQANITNVRQTIRESRARTQVAEWLADVARLILLTLRERMAMPFMVKRSVDPFAAQQSPQAMLEAASLWTEIRSEDIGDLDVDVSIDVASLSPVAEDTDRTNWVNLLAVLSNPAVNAYLMTPRPEAPDEPSPILRKTCVLNGIKSDQEIREVWRVGQQIRQEIAAAAQAQAALAKQPEPIKMSLALKGEDLLGPLGIFFMRLIAREEGLPEQAAQMAQPMPALGEGRPGRAMLKAPGQGGLATGIPAKPMGVQ